MFEKGETNLLLLLGSGRIFHSGLKVMADRTWARGNGREELCQRRIVAIHSQT